jgi:hypothetical protein
LAGAPFTNCVQSVYSGAYTEGKATVEWLKGSADVPITSSTTVPKKALGFAFLNIVWKSAKTVGFGQKGTHLVAWYCAAPAPNLAGLVDGTDYDKAATCETGAAPLLHNKCFNKESMAASNAYRLKHLVTKWPDIVAGGDPEKSAGSVHSTLVAATTCTAGLQKAAITIPKATCLDIYYKIKPTEKTHTQIGKAMTAAWYAQKANYDFATGKATNKKTYDDVAGLTALLWKGAATDFAAFGIKAGCAAARFCVLINEKKKNTAGTAVDPALTATNYKTNVLKQCVDDNGVDFCYAKD